MSNTVDLCAQPSAPTVNERSISTVMGGDAIWPYVERRRAPRRLDDGIAADRRQRVATKIVKQALPVPAPHIEADRDRHIRGYRQAVVAIDVLAALLASNTAFFLRFGDASVRGDAVYLWGGLILPVLWVLGIAMNRGYERRFMANSAEEYRRVLHAGLALIAAISIVSFLGKTPFARGYVGVALPMTAFISLMGRYVARRILRRARAQGRCMQQVLVVGHEWPILDLVAELNREPDSGLRVVGACVPGGEGSLRLVEAGVPVIGDLGDVVDAVAATGADVLAVTACVEFGAPELRKVCWALENTDVEIVVAPALMEVAGPRLHIRPVDKLPLLHVEKPEFTGVRRIIKGVFDRVVAGLALLMLAPVLIGIALAVRLTSSGPALFRQTRIGVKGEPFKIYKFRSMHVNAEQHLAALQELNERADGLLFKIREDPRVTGIGKFLRRYSLDELPQLLNVLKGDMSLVGPRPPLPSEVEQYRDDVKRRLLVRPGVTGLWQVSGRSNLDWDESVRLDLRYVENWSLVYDFEILWKTVYAVVRGAGAY